MTGSHQIGALSVWRRIWTVSVSPAGSQLFTAMLVIQLLLQFTNRLLFDSFGWWGIPLLLAFYAIVLGALVAVAHRRNPPPVIDFDEGVLRIGSEVTAFADVTEAWVPHVVTARRDDLYLWFGGHKRRHGMVVLRSRAGGELSDHDRQVLAAMVERSGIQLPQPKFDPYDPKGKFAWLDQQGFVTKDQAVRAILHTPVSGDAVRP